MKFMTTCAMMVVTKTPTKQRQSAVFVCRKTTAYLRTGTKPGTVEVSLSRCDPRLTKRLVGTQPYRALCIGGTETAYMNHPDLTPRQVNRFWNHVNKTADCWLWTASTDRDGYGTFGANGVTYRAHRLAWMLANGEIPSGFILLHSCDTPNCCNPAHLSIGTHQDNVIDRLRKGRGAKGESMNTAKLTEADVIKIREVFASGISGFVIAEQYDVLPCTIYRIASGKYWRHVGGPRCSRPYSVHNK